MLYLGRTVQQGFSTRGMCTPRGMCTKSMGGTPPVPEGRVAIAALMLAVYSGRTMLPFYICRAACSGVVRVCSCTQPVLHTGADWGRVALSPQAALMLGKKAALGLD